MDFFDGCGEEEKVIPYPLLSGDNELKCIILSEFDNVKGAKITIQTPVGFISEAEFESVADYIIPPPEICNKVVRFSVADHHFLSHAIIIEDNKYPRGMLMFSVCFVLCPNAKLNGKRWDSLVTLIAKVLKRLEIESQFLAKKAEKQNFIFTVFTNVMNSLNKYGTCSIPIDRANVLSLQLPPPIYSSSNSITILEHEVPIQLTDLSAMVQLDWDITIQHIISFIDGIRFIKKIAIDAHVSVINVQLAVAQLVKMNLCAMVDIFQFSNIYMSLPGLGEMPRNEQLKSNCIAFVQKSNETVEFREVYQLYCALQLGVRVSEVCLQYAHLTRKIDIRRLIIFGVIHSLVRRVHQYPICLPQQKRSPQNDGGTIDYFLSFADGKHSCDEICVTLAKPLISILSVYNSDPRFCVVYH